MLTNNAMSTNIAKPKTKRINQPRTFAFGTTIPKTKKNKKQQPRNPKIGTFLNTFEEPKGFKTIDTSPDVKTTKIFSEVKEKRSVSDYRKPTWPGWRRLAEMYNSRLAHYSYEQTPGYISRTRVSPRISSIFHDYSINNKAYTMLNRCIYVGHSVTDQGKIRYVFETTDSHTSNPDFLNAISRPIDQFLDNKTTTNIERKKQLIAQKIKNRRSRKQQSLPQGNNSNTVTEYMVEPQ